MIFIILIAEFIFDMIVTVLNIGSSQQGIPSAFIHLIDLKTYSKTIEYQSTLGYFHLIKEAFHLVTFLSFLYLGGFRWLEGLLNNMQLHGIFRSAAFFMLFILLNELISLPFDAVKHFYIEQKFGFNTMDFNIFVTDFFKKMLLIACIGTPLFSTLTLFFEKFGNYAFILAYLFFMSLQVFFTWIAPLVILPMFNRLEPLPEGSYRTTLLNYLQSQKTEVQEIYVMDGSKRSNKSNAFFTGFGKSRRLVLFDTLLKQMSEKELLAIVAHELGHYEKNHILKGLALSALLTFLSFLLAQQLLYSPWLYEMFGLSSIQIYAGFIFLSILSGPIQTLTSIPLNKISRIFEFEADAYSVTSLKQTGITEGAQYLTDALKKLYIKNYSVLTPHPLQVILSYSHPPVLERLKAIQP